jgi:hypothetical protein
MNAVMRTDADCGKLLRGSASRGTSGRCSASLRRVGRAGEGRSPVAPVADGDIDRLAADLDKVRPLSAVRPGRRQPAMSRSPGWVAEKKVEMPKLSRPSSPDPRRLSVLRNRAEPRRFSPDVGFRRNDASALARPGPQRTTIFAAVAATTYAIEDSHPQALADAFLWEGCP